jgi:hypothetical protein
MQPIKYKKGDRVSILNQTLSGKPFIEGDAILTEFVGKDDYPPYLETWKVRFVSELSNEYTRVISP